jgi:hypothetical protein
MPCVQNGSNRNKAKNTQHVINIKKVQEVLRRAALLLSFDTTQTV